MRSSKKSGTTVYKVNLVSFLLRVDDHESQSTLVVDTATVFTATVDVQSIVAHSPSPYSSTSSTNTTTSTITTTEVSVGATPPTTLLQ
uniref:Uncharacterized protein n=1 Tax=Amphimedon queenslandica TaxID=400682 RepID=A0A1X7TKW4_AMPQE